MKNKTLQDRFDAFVSYEPMSGCWLWVSHRDKREYNKIATQEKRRSLKMKVV
jgi:hypothetical protein